MRPKSIDVGEHLADLPLPDACFDRHPLVGRGTDTLAADQPRGRLYRPFARIGVVGHARRVEVAGRFFLPDSYQVLVRS